MEPNPIWQKLGYGEEDRVVIFHADDVGMCHASVAAYIDLIEFGLLSSAATMVPCSWFPSVAAYCREHPEVDMGVHLTLTSEFDAYRWGPISTRDTASGLIDEEGYFYHRSEESQQHGDPAAVEVELNAQIERALAAGIDVTHVDTHMGTVVHPKYMPFYIQAAISHQLPSLLIRWNAATVRETLGMDDEAATVTAATIKTLEAQGRPLLDNLCQLSLEDVAADRVEQIKETLIALPPGITHYIIHPAKDTPELRAIAPHWRGRVADYEALMSEELRDFIAAEGIKITNYRSLRDLIRG